MLSSEIKAKRLVDIALGQKVMQANEQRRKDKQFNDLTLQVNDLEKRVSLLEGSKKKKK